jgi:nitrite reductase/ring-hydroxylating ferredoxin subunit
MMIEVAKLSDIAPGGLIAVEVKDEEVVLGNYDGRIYAINRRCGHMNAPMELGTLNGYIMTCPLHSVQFDITTGEALCPPVPRDFGNTVIPEALIDYFGRIRELTEHIKTCNIKTYPVEIDGDTIKVDI